MSATATPAKPKGKKAPNNKITRLIVPALYDTSGLQIKEIVDPETGKPVEALYFYDAVKAGVIEKLPEPVRSGNRGRPANRWKLTKSTRDKVRRQRQRAAEKSVEPVVEDALV